MAQIATFVALLKNGVALGSALSASFSGIGALALRFGGSLLLSSVAGRLLAPKVAQVDARRELAGPTGTPEYRYVYGEARATGTPLARPVVGAAEYGYIYGAWLLNSRPSAGPFTLYLDGREVTFSGDPYDFAGSGALASNQPFAGHCQMWIQRGAETGPPAAFLSGAPWSGSRQDLWLESDAFAGLTVVYLILRNGANAFRQQRWPSAPPVVEVEGRFSRVWDPRDGAQDPDDPDSWVWSDNQALCLLDALRRNPREPWPLAQLHLTSFEEAADAADEAVALNAGGTEPRYRVSGTLVWGDAELEDQVDPLVVAGAADLIRIGGTLGVVPGVWQAPLLTVTDFLRDGFEFSDMRPGQAAPAAIRVAYANAERGYEAAELPPWPVPGSSGRTTELLTLAMVTSPTQAARVRNIVGRRSLLQRDVSGLLAPEALELVAGARLTLDLPAPFGAVMDAVYRVTSCHPALMPLGEDGAEGRVAMLIPVEASEDAESVYAWTPATDEPEVIEQVYDGTRPGAALPGTLVITTGAGVDLNTGGTVIPRLRVAFEPSVTPNVIRYDLQVRVSGGDWGDTQVIDGAVVDGSGDVFAHVLASEGVTYDVRVRTVANAGESDWRTATGVTVDFEISGGSAVAGLGSATFGGTAPASVNTAHVRVYRTATAVFGTSTPVTDLEPVTPGAAFSVVAGDGAITNLLANPGFSSGASWSTGTGWSIGAGVASHSGGSTGQLDQALVIASGATVRLGVTLSATSAGGVSLRLVGATVPAGSTETTDGLKVATLTAPASMTDFRITANPAHVGSVDDAAAYVETVDALPQGPAYYWVLPVSLTGLTGAPDGPYLLTII